MTREKAIIHMTLRRDELKHSVGDLDEDIKAFDMAIKALEQTRWIPVSERLPEDYTDVIATVEEHYKDEIGYFVFPQARYSREYGWEWPYEAGTDYWTGLNGVVAWMPLPEPYKQEVEE